MANEYIKKSVFTCTRIPAINNLFKKRKRGATALFYHGVEHNIINPLVQEIHISFTQFEKQIKYILKNYEIISLDYLYDCISNGYKINPYHVLLTFDDGYKNNLGIAAPFLRSLNIPFSVFISTRHIDNGSRFPTYYLRTAVYYTEQENISIASINKNYNISSHSRRILAVNAISNIIKSVPQETVTSIIQDLMKLLENDRWSELNNLFFSDALMTWDDVRALHKSGATIGSHCHDHAVLHNNQSNREIIFQLKTSKGLISKYLGECKYFAYPNGSMKKIALKAAESVKENEYLLGFSIVPGEIENKMNASILPRIIAHSDFDAFRFYLNAGFLKNKKYYNWASDVMQHTI